MTHLSAQIFPCHDLGQLLKSIDGLQPFPRDSNDKDPAWRPWWMTGTNKLITILLLMAFNKAVITSVENDLFSNFSSKTRWI